MTKVSTLALSCTLLVFTGCQSDAEPGGLGSSGSASGGGGSAPVGMGGSSSGGGGAATQAGTSSNAGNGSGSGGGGQPSGGSSAGGSPTAGTAQGGQAGSPVGGAAGSAGVAGSGGAAGGGSLPSLEECPGKPSVDRLTNWQASGEGLTVPATGSILVQDGAAYAGKVKFVGAEWHVIPVYIANKYGSTADLTKAATFTLTYSATSALHVQLRSLSHWSGGDQWATDIPATGGNKETHVFSFAAAGWKSLFGQPVLSFADTLKEGMGMVFVGNSENTIVFYGLRIDGYSPPCQ